MARPLLIAANHLTMADSALIAWGLGSTLQHVVEYRGLPWNVPEQARVESSWVWRVLAYLMKCVPVPRGGDRRIVADVLKGLRHLMQRGEVVLMFPEGGRSRSGRVDTESVAHGVGRLIKELGNCRVLCVYLAGRPPAQLVQHAGGRGHVLYRDARFRASHRAARHARVAGSGRSGAAPAGRDGGGVSGELGVSVGNDVVDLVDPETLREEQHPRFDERVYAPEELALLQRSESEHVTRWLLWAAKEAAYKAEKRDAPDTVFSPRRLCRPAASPLGGRGSGEGVRSTRRAPAHSRRRVGRGTLCTSSL